MRPSDLNFCVILAAIAFTIASSHPPCAFAQTATTNPIVASAPDYSAESIVIERAESIYTFAADGTCIQERSIAARIQSDAAVRALGVVSVAFAADSQKVEFLYARVRHPDGTVVETPAADAIEMPEPVTREAPLYSDLKEKQLPIRALRSGDTLEWRARITTTKAQAPNQIWGQENLVDDVVTLGEVIELRVPAGTAITVWSPTAKPVESDLPASGATPALHVYRWTAAHLKPTAGKQADAEAEAKKKAIWTADQELDADQGKLPTIAWTTFKSWEAVGAWYRTLQADRVAPSPEIKAKAAELIAGKSTDEEKVRALYAYVATQIRYIGVDFGIGRYQPHTAAEILANQYGDCKDKHTLLAAMLNAAGIQSDAVLIGAGIRFNPAVPSPAAFNHVITHLTLAAAAGQPAQQVWLDTTAEIAPYRMLVSVIRDHEALVVPATAAPYSSKIPADPPFPFTQTWDASGKLDSDGTTHSHIAITYRNDSELDLRAAFHNTSPAQYGQLVQQFVGNLGYGGTSSNSEVTRPDDTAIPFKIAFDYERIKGGDWEHYRISAQLPYVILPRFSDQDPLVHSIDLGSPRTEEAHATLKLPEGWGATLPDDIHAKCPYATYDETYRLEKGTIYSERRLHVIQQHVPTSALKDYKKWADEANIGEGLFIQLTRTYQIPARTLPSTSGKTEPTVTVASEGPPIVLPGSEEALKLLQKASDLYQQGQYAEVPALLDQVQKLNPEQQYLWSMRGAIAVMNGQNFEAAEDYQKELSLHADSLQVYPYLFRLQEAHSQKKEMQTTLRAWVAAAPTDPEPISLLMDALIQQGDNKTAAAMGESAFAKIDGTDAKADYFHTRLGLAQLKSGETQKGKATLEEVLNQTSEVTALNDAAFNLADAHLDLPLAEKSIQTALDKLTEESNTWTLSQDAQAAEKIRQRSRLIPAVWDSMGWTLFREGKLDDALSYIRAAWLNQATMYNGGHLGDLLAAQGNKSLAIAAYELALASAPFYNRDGDRIAPNATQLELQRKIDALRKQGIKSAIASQGSPFRALQNLRTIPLRDAGANNGMVTSEYRILLRDGKAVRVHAGGKNSIGGAEAWIAKADFTHFSPTNSHATIVRTGIVNCHAKTCELILEP